jgi:Tfp pilus assembly protein PilE
MCESRKIRRKGYTLMEACVAIIIICILVTIAAPMYGRAIEQARLDSAAGNLKAIWSAQRAYWLKHHTFAVDLVTLGNEDLISVSIVETQALPDAMYVYGISSAGADFFIAYAVRGGRVWSGEIQVNELGQLTGSISKTDGAVLSPQTPE